MAAPTQFAAYYAPLVAVYGSGVVPDGVTGSPFNAGDPPATKLAAINAWTVPGPDRLVPVSDAVDYLRLNGLWLPIKAAAATGEVGAAAAVDIVSDLRISTIDFNAPIVSMLLGDLQRANLLSVDNANALIAMKKAVMPWWQSVGLFWAPTTFDLIAAGLLANTTYWTYSIKSQGFDQDSKNIVVNIGYQQVLADGVTPTTMGAADSINSPTLTPADIAQKALTRIVNVFLPRDAALAALSN
jgi:hypothetical protein